MAASSVSNHPRYYEQAALWGNAPDAYQVQVRADVLDILPTDVQSVLDLGCGDGHVTNALPASHRVVGVDISAEALRYLSRPGIVASGLALPFADRAFDLVMANDVLEHFDGPDRERILGEMQRVAGKYVLFTSPHDEQLEANYAACADCGARYHVHWHHHAFRGEELPNELSDGKVLMEVRYSGDVTLPPPDPFVPLLHGLGVYRTWDGAVCPQCGSGRQTHGGEDSALIRLIAARRCAKWYGELPPMARCNRSEIMALYGPARMNAPPNRLLPTRRGDLRAIDFANPLQCVREFTQGSSWAVCRLGEGAAQTTEGVVRSGDERLSAAVEIRLPVIPQVGACIVLEASSVSGGTLDLYALDGVFAKQTLIGKEDVSGHRQRLEFSIENPWSPDRFGSGLMVLLSGDASLHQLHYRAADSSTCPIELVELQPGHNVVSAEDAGVRVSWGLEVDRTGWIPMPCLTRRARPPRSSTDAAALAIDLLNSVAGSEAGSYASRLKELAAEGDRLRDAAERAHYQVGVQLSELSNHHDQLSARHDALEQRHASLHKVSDEQKATIAGLQHELAIRQGIKGGVKEILNSLLCPVIGPRLDTPRQDYQKPWHPLARPSAPAGARTRVLILSHMFPHPEQLSSGPFVHEQVKALRLHGGVDARVIVCRPYWMRSNNPVKMYRSNRCYRRYHAACLRWWDLDGVPVAYLPYRIFGPWLTQGWSYRSSVMDALPWIRRDFDFDLVHAHTAYLDGSAGLAASRSCGVPLIITEHTGPFTILMANSVVKRWTLRALHSAERVVVVSEAQRRAVANHLLPSRRDHLVVLPNVVDTELFSPPTDWRPEPAAPRIVFVGYFVPIKQIPMLLEAFRQVRRSIPGARLSLVGGGEIEQQEKDLLVEIRGMGLEDSVEVLGHQSRQEIARIMREKCDLLVLCSRTETFGCVVIEALASGKPVVVTRCGGPEDIIINEDLGLICENNNPQALADAILRVVERLPRFDSSRIREHAEEQFSFAAVARRIAALYESTLTAKARPSFAPSPVAG